MQSNLTEEEQVTTSIKPASSSSNVSQTLNEQTTGFPSAMVNTMDILKTCLIQGKFHDAAKILSTISNYQNSSTTHILWTGITILEKNLGRPRIDTKVLETLKTRYPDQNEVTIFQERQLEKSKHYIDELEFQNLMGHGKTAGILRHNGIFLETPLALSYRALLSYLLEWGNINHIAMINNLLSEFQEKDTPFIPLLEIYGEVLFEQEGAEFLKNFIKEFCSKSSAKDFGLIVHLQCLQLIYKHLNNQKTLRVLILEQASAADPSNHLVLILCKAVLQDEIQFDSGIGGLFQIGRLQRSADDNQQRKDIIRCLQISIKFLDFEINKESSDGWKFLSNCLSLVFIIGDRKCAKILVNLWTKKRKSRWNSMHFQNTGKFTKDQEITYYVFHKAFVCYLLDSEENPFVKDVLSGNEKEVEYLMQIMNEFAERKLAMQNLMKLVNVSPEGNCTKKRKTN